MASLLNLISWPLTFSYDLSSELCARSSLFVTSLFAFCSALATSFDTSSGDFDLLQPASARAATTKIGIRYSRMQFPLVVGTRSRCTLGFLLVPLILALPLTASSNAPPPAGRALTIREGSALSDLDKITVRIADVAAPLAVLLQRLRDELGPSTFPKFIARL